MFQIKRELRVAAWNFTQHMGEKAQRYRYYHHQLWQFPRSSHDVNMCLAFPDRQREHQARQQLAPSALINTNILPNRRTSGVDAPRQHKKIDGAAKTATTTAVPCYYSYCSQVMIDSGVQSSTSFLSDIFLSFRTKNQKQTQFRSVSESIIVTDQIAVHDDEKGQPHRPQYTGTRFFILVLMYVRISTMYILTAVLLWTECFLNSYSVYYSYHNRFLMYPPPRVFVCRFIPQQQAQSRHFSCVSLLVLFVLMNMPRTTDLQGTKLASSLQVKSRSSDFVVYP